MIKLSDKLRNVFGTHGEIPVQNVNSPIFIIGCMRSGTTFLADKLTSHPQLLKIGTELNEVWDEVGGVTMINRCKYKGITDINSHYTYNMTIYLQRFIEESKSIKRHLMRFNELLKKKSTRVFYDWENIVPINKSPHLMNKVGYVQGLFPKSKFVFIVRDIFAHSASMKTHFDNLYEDENRRAVYVENSKECWAHFWGDSPPQDLAGYPVYPSEFSLIPKMWIRQNKLAINELKRLPDNRYCIIKYADMIKNQENTYRKIFQFLGLKNKHQEMERKISQKKVIHKNTSTKGHPLLKWLRHLSEKEKRVIEEVIVDNRKGFNSIMRFIDSKKITGFSTI